MRNLRLNLIYLSFFVQYTFFKQEAQRATVAHLSTMNAREILEWNQI